MEAQVRKLFERYEQLFRKSLAGDADMDEVASLYASAFIAASPAGVMVGKNDDQLRQVMEQGYAHYRAIGTKEMRIRAVRVSPIDEHHCVAHVAWTSSYARKDRPDVTIDFDVHYLVQKLGGDPKIFGWVSGDEQEVLRKHGIG
ncbi:nuclear transport factor 2 family protein [Mesorhizobium sp.]|uniref:nuclear transport factor 2 family protein n=1 Tax=Mesorhizobium sp. TaxID=1871066 RepID=UPI000FE5472F|nr:nuclear transport factor 2 family protein [Mesorhizobium sp.]RWE65838.1 MAG: nuclear transport factor 2 family protein [Mesorhizobium sp.]RWF00972.1 MAG: nuclear transport factor 2 family protein [Mesorhizobium sp.]TIU21454.1 MAG: nuclear transport factor 2 family protein [Mesorhizobium sp.]TIX04916.1 MAG: nuclear transport factor 2 family protein [Mesorhizobium sp.]